MTDLASRAFGHKDRRQLKAQSFEPALALDLDGVAGTRGTTGQENDLPVPLAGQGAELAY